MADKPSTDSLSKGVDHNGPRLFTERRSEPGLRSYRRMSPKEVQRWEDSKTGNTKIQPVQIEGKVP